MKRNYFLLLLATLLSWTSFAQTNNFVIYAEDGSNFILTLNGIKQNPNTVSNIKITDIPGEMLSVHIKFEDVSRPSLTKKIYYPDMGMERRCAIVETKKKGTKIKFMGEQPISSSQIVKGQYTTSYHTTDAVEEYTDPGTTTSVIEDNTNDEDTSNDPNNDPITVPDKKDEVIVSNGPSVELNYNWYPNAVHNFSVKQTDDVTMSMMGMKMTDKFTTLTDFTLHIQSISAKGEGIGVLYLNSYQVTDSKGNTMASLKDLPKNAIVSDVVVDKKGNFSFPKKISLIMTENATVMAYAKEENGQIKMGGSDGNTQVDTYVQFDPKTGSLKAGITVKENQPTTKATVKIDENANVIDALPYDYLSLLALPDGKVAQGDKTKMQTGIYNIDITATSIADGNAVLNYKMNTDKSQNATGGKVESETGDQSMMMSFPGMEDMPGMTDEDKAEVESTKGMMPDMSCDMNSTFDYTAGMFKSVKGTLDNSMNMMGMKMSVHSEVEMNKR